MNFPSFSSHMVVDTPISQSFPPQNLTMVMLIIISRNPYLLWIFLLSPNFHLLHGCWVNWDLLLRRLILYSSYIRTLIGWKSLRLLLELGSLCSRMHENGHADTGATCRHVAKSQKCIENYNDTVPDMTHLGCDMYTLHLSKFVVSMIPMPVHVWLYKCLILYSSQQYVQVENVMRPFNRNNGPVLGWSSGDRYQVEVYVIQH